MRKPIKINGNTYNKILNVALIGYGGMGSYHANQIIKLPFLNLNGIYDIDIKRVSLAQSRGIKAYANPQEIYNDKNVDLVVIVTPNESHAEYVINAASAGKNIVCDKPVTLDSKTFYTMLDAVNINNVKFMVHQNRRWDNDYLTAKNIYDNNLVGKVYNIESKVQGSNFLLGWRCFKENGGGMLLDWGVHLIDQILNMIKHKVISVYCTASYVREFEVDDGFKLTLGFDDGNFCNIEVDTNTFIVLPRWRLFGDAGTSEIKSWNSRAKMVLWKEKNDYNVKHLKAGNGLTKTMAKRTRKTIITRYAPRIRASWKSFYQEMYLTIVDNKPQYIKSDEVMRVLKVIEACFKSIESNELIKVDI